MRRVNSLMLILAGLMGLESAFGGEILELPAIADTTLIEFVPDHNMGHQPFINAGSTANVTAPGTGLPSRNRALLLFDLTQVPTGSRIVRAELHVEVTGEPTPGNGNPSLFALHRVLRPWGEGTKVSQQGSPGLGDVATLGEATWQSPFALTGTNWTTPGGAQNIDFVAAVTATQFIEDASGYVFPSEDEVVADVQRWLDSPAENYGWMLRSLSEMTRGTARRFGSREDGDNVAHLVVEFLPPPRVDSVTVQAGQLEIRFAGRAGAAYSVEYTPLLPAAQWMTLQTFDPLPADATLVATDALTNVLRFYRVGRTP